MHKPEDQPTAIDLDLELAALMDESAHALERLGITPADLLEELASVHSETLNEHYGADYMREIEQKIAEYQQSTAQHAAHE